VVEEVVVDPPRQDDLHQATPVTLGTQVTLVTHPLTQAHIPTHPHTMAIAHMAVITIIITVNTPLLHHHIMGPIPPLLHPLTHHQTQMI